MSRERLNDISKEFLYSKVIHIENEEKVSSDLAIDVDEFYKTSQNIPKNSISKICLHDCMMHVDNPEVLIKKSSDLLSDEGRLSFYINIFEGQKWFSKWLYRRRKDKEKFVELDDISLILEKNAFVIDKNFVFNNFSPSKVYFEITKIDNKDLNN